MLSKIFNFTINQSNEYHSRGTIIKIYILYMMQINVEKYKATPPILYVRISNILFSDKTCSIRISKI